MNSNTVPYVYLVGWASLDKYYIGVRYKKGCHPRDFWVDYFTSSKHVHKFHKMHGEPDVIMIIREHKTAKAAVIHEDKLLRRLHAVKSDKFINRARGGAEWNVVGLVFTPEMRAKRSAAALNRTPEMRAKRSEAMRNVSAETRAKRSAAMTGRKFSAETRAKMSEAQSNVSAETRAKRIAAMAGKNKADDVRAKISAPMMGHKVSDETKAKISATKLASGNTKLAPVTCPHCGKIGAPGPMAKWHFDNCRYKATAPS